MTCLGQEVIGMLVAFPMKVDKSADLSKVDPVLLPYCKLEEDNSYYICGLALFTKYRGQGIGKQFMAFAEEHAKAKGFSKLSLIVFEDNQIAKNFYDRHGFKETARERVVAHQLIHYKGDAVLMVKIIE